MLFQQLRTLLWRNAVLKKRGYLTTILEILIPTLIILIIAKNSREVETEDIFHGISNSPLYIVNNSTRITNMDIRNRYYISFSNDFDTQTKNLFIENFKSNQYFNSFKYIEPNANFTKQSDNNEYYLYNGELQSINHDYSDEMFINNLTVNNTTENVTSNNVTNDTVPITLDNNGSNNDKPNNITYHQEYKILIFDNEKESINAYRNDIIDYYKYNLYTYNNVDNFIISFKSLTEYTLYSDYYLYDSELIDELVISNDEIYEVYSNYYLQYTNFHILTNNALMKTLNSNSNNNIPEIEFSYKALDKIGYNTKRKVNKALEMIPLFMLFYFIPCVCSLLGHLVIEKESKIKESLVIIGMKKSTFWLSWAITYGAIIIIASSIASFAISYLKIFYKINVFILLITFIVYGFSCISISFAISTLINKSKTSNTVGALVVLTFFALYFLNMFLKNETAKWICCFALPPVSFLSLFDYLIKLERQNLSVTFLTLFDNSLLRNYFIAIVSSFIIYFLLALYLDNVLPQGSNLHKKWHFFITEPLHCCMGKKRKDDQNNNNKINQNNPFIQKDPEGLRKSVEVSHIGRTFKVKEGNLEILKDINFNAYYDEIFAILGHNGAGKTTLIRIMTGILSSTRGEVYYDNVPIHGNEIDICKQLGYCPQFDTFSKNLTVGEHVKLFAGIKGIKVDVDEVLKDIDLLNKKKNYPKQLSGGQRRKLSITLALLGSPKYVFLDEPTTGLDPYSRKNIWELLSRKKKGCTMFVTTHYMDEADLLADRKMIISNGNITCLGTSIFLKKTFNMNYSLDITLTRENDINCIDSLIDYYCPGASNTKLISISQYNDNNNTNNNNSDTYIVTYLLPMEHANYFKNIFEALNNLIDNNDNSISNFSITAPTLEELFIKLESNKMGDSPELSQMNRDIQKVKNVTTVDMNSCNDDDTKRFVKNLDPVFGKTNINKSSALRQIYSIIKIRIKIFLRNKTFAFIYTLFPICLIIACIFIENKYIDSLYGSDITYKPLEIKPSLYNGLKWFKEPKVSNGAALDIINKINIGNNLYETVDNVDDLTIKSNQVNGNESKYIGGFSGVVNSNKTLEFTIFHDVSYRFVIPLGINYIYNTILENYNINKKFSVNYNPLPSFYYGEYDENDKENIINQEPEMKRIELESVLSIIMAIAISLSISIFGPLTVKEREDGITWQLYLNGTSRINYWIGVFLSDTICIFVPTLFVVLAGYFNGISIFGLNVIIYSIIITLLWIIGSLFHQYVVSHFFKRYDKCSNLFIILNPILTLFVGIYSAMIVDNDDENTERKREETPNARMMRYIFYLTLVLYVPSTIVFFYTKIAGYIGNYKLNLSEDTYTSFTKSKVYQDIANNNNLKRIEQSKEAAKAFYKINSPTFKEFLKSKQARNCAIIIIALVIAYILILYLKVKIQNKSLKCHKEYTEEEKQIKNKKLMSEPKDVYNEFKRVQQAVDRNNKDNDISMLAYRLNKDYSVSLSEMKKRRKEKEKEDKINNKYENKKSHKNNKNKNDNDNDNDNNKNNNNMKESAFTKMDDRIIFNESKKTFTNRIVDDVTFGINAGECLGLLGPNGAGKTTSIYMMTGLISRTHGKVIYGNKNLDDSDLSELSLGYCSQHDSLWKLLTVKETIQFYLNICGYPRKDIPNYTKALIEACGIESHTNKKVCEISGGTKRKLSLIIAICSSPNYLILDEPSAGMDPFTRRYMWELISQLKKVRETSTILTTHSTEEAEALCDRIAILIKGNLVCIDTPNSIRMNQSNRYVLEVFTDHPQEFEDVYINKYNLFGLDQSTSKKQYNVENSFNHQKYTVEMKTKNIAKVFSIMEMAKEKGHVSQYNFGQYSLEQVFIDFVNNSE